jgi:AP-1 complex subunit gamma-1
VDVEIQQRAVEYAALIDLGDIRSAVLERMPVPEIKEEKVVPLISGPSRSGTTSKKATSAAVDVCYYIRVSIEY